MDTCTAPEEIEAWELEAYLHGHAPIRVVQHVARCPACSARVNELQDFQQRLQRALARVDCPAPETLLLHRWHQLPPDRVRKVDTHLTSCAACRTEYAAFAGPESGPGQQFLTEARRGWAVLTATLQPLLAPAPAVRGAEAPPTVYRVPETTWEIILTQTTATRGYVLSGQLLGADAADLTNARAGLLANERLLLETAVDPTGWFGLQPLQAGRYTLWIDVVAAHIRAPEVVVGPEPTTPC